MLGPLLLLLFINDLPDKIISKTRLFADDCIVYRPVYDHSDCAALQQDLDALAEWEAKWGMAFHPQKCSVLSVSRARSPIRYPYKLKGHTLETEDSTKYLGVDLQTTLSWKTHIDRISKKVNSMLDLDATFGLVARTQKPTPTSAWCGQTWNIAHLFETHIKKNSSGSLR